MKSPTTVSPFGKYREIILAVAFFLVFDLAVLVLNFYISFQIAEDASAINLAGRQRMLSQRMAKALLSAGINVRQGLYPAADLAEIKETVALFDSTLAGFEHGATVIGGDQQAVFLAAVTTPHGRALLAESQALWRPYLALMTPLTSGTNTSPAQFEAADRYARANNLKLLTLMNSLTTQLEQTADAKATTLRTVQTVGILLALLNFAFILFRLIRRLKENDQRVEVAHRARNEFLIAMSHELRTPLNAILGYTQILRQDAALSKQQHGALQSIEESGQHLLTLINDLLDLARMEDKLIELQPQSIQLRVFLDAIADIIRDRAGQKGLLFIREIAPELPGIVQADEKRLRQVLLNLLGNAVKFTVQGQISLRVRLLSQGVHGARLRFEVADTGVGIGADQLEAIFRPFEPLGEPRRRAGGTGRGLALSRRFVQLMGGDIRVESRVGEGSRFWFELDLPVIGSKAEVDRDAEVAADGALLAPPAHDIGELHRLARIGNMQDILLWANGLDERYRPFANQVRVLASGYQSKAILNLVRKHLKNKEPS